MRSCISQPNVVPQRRGLRLKVSSDISLTPLNATHVRCGAVPGSSHASSQTDALDLFVRILVSVLGGAVIPRADEGTSSGLSHDSLRYTWRGANVPCGGQITARVGVAGSFFHSTTEQLTSGISYGVRVRSSPVGDGKRLALTALFPSCRRCTILDLHLHSSYGWTRS
jgi:hypothetical protein